MPTYQYEAMDHTGREVKDSIDAATQEEAQQLIRQKGFFVTKIAEKAKKAKQRASAEEGGPAQEEGVHDRPDLDQAALHVHPAALDLAGRRSADPAQPEDPRGPVQAGRAQERAAETSSRTSRAARRSRKPCAKHPKAFDRLYCNMIKAGEAGGALEAILQRLADFKEKSQSLKRRIKSAMVYPIVVISSPA